MLRPWPRTRNQPARGAKFSSRPPTTHLPRELTMNPSTPHRIAIASGGTGGHFFPGLAVAQRLVAAGCELCLLVSRKKIDQELSRHAGSIPLESLAAVGLEKGRLVSFVRGWFHSYLLANDSSAAGGLRRSWGWAVFP